MQTKQRLDVPLSLKSVSDSGEFEGYGSVFGVKDSHDDVVMSGAFAASLRAWSDRKALPALLWQHRMDEPIGVYTEMTAGDQFNQQHITLAGYEKDTQTPADELAASRTARAAVFIRNDPARPTQTGELVGMLPAPKGKRFTMTEQQTLLSHGVATAYVESGVLRIQRDVTTYRKNAYGVADNSYLDSETLHTSAYVLRKLKSVITSKYGRHKLASDGTRFGPGQAIVTPAVIKGELLATYRQLERAGIVENYELFKQYLVLERDASDPNRLNTLFPPDYVNQLLFPDGDRSHAVVVTVSDRRYRLKGLQTGEVAVYDDQGQSVTLTREGIVVDGAGKTITFRNAPRARFEMDLEVTGQVKDLCDSGGTTMSAMRLAYNGHRHRENGQGSNTDKPDKAMEA